MIYNIDDLCAEVKGGTRFSYLPFYGHTPPLDQSIDSSCLSQHWLQWFEIDSVAYTCAEQYMMAEKARLFGDGLALKNIMAAKLPSRMKSFGRQVRGFEQETWDKAAYGIVLRASEAKFAQNQELLQFLLKTGDRILVEASPTDRVWGIGLGKDHPSVVNPLKWRGKNLLGFALTETRDKLKKGAGCRLFLIRAIEDVPLFIEKVLKPDIDYTIRDIKNPRMYYSLSKDAQGRAMIGHTPYGDGLTPPILMMEDDDVPQKIWNARESINAYFAMP